MLATLTGPAYIERVSVSTPAQVTQAKKAIKKALEIQKQGLGFTFIEVVSSCPTNWGLTPVKAMEFVRDKMIPYYPLGVFKDITAEEGK
jgi:2-oxoglutarate ferredoxin oxidoreductase subunit beta